MGILLTLYLLLLSTEVSSANNWNIPKLLAKAKTERSFETLVLYTGSKQVACVQEDILSEPLVPVIILSSFIDCSLQKHNFSREVLFLICVETSAALSSIESLGDCLGSLRGRPMIFYWNMNYEESSPQKELHSMFQYCEKNFIPNVVGIFANFQDTGKFFTYTRFPQFRLETKSFKEDLFPYRIGNLYGAPIRTLPDNVHPRTIVYWKTENSSIEITGYVANIIKMFAAKHNGTLVYPLPVSPKVGYFYRLLKNMTIADEIDMPISASSPAGLGQLAFFSDVVEQASWFPMIPLAEPIPTREIFVLILCSRLSVTLGILWLCFTTVLTLSSWSRRIIPKDQHIVLCFLFHGIATIRIILGQAAELITHYAISTHIIYSFLLISGMVFSATYLAYFQSFLTSAPKPVEIFTFDDLLNSKVKIWISSAEFKPIQALAGADFEKKYNSTIKTIEDFNELFVHRQALDTQNGYLVTSSLWTLIKERQKRMVRPKFHQSEYMSFTKALYLHIPLHEHSIYREPLNNLISQLKESGILEFWQSASYINMLMAGAVNTTRQIHPNTLYKLNADDFSWVGVIWLSGIALSMIAFIAEFIYRKRNVLGV